MKKGPEYELQQTCLQWFREKYPDLLMFSVPNEACFRNRFYFLGIGMLDGVSDTIIVAENEVCFVEFKSKRKYQSPEQKDFQSKVESLGWTYVVVKSVEAFQEFCARF